MNPPIEISEPTGGSMWDYFEVYPADPRHGIDFIDKPMWHPLYNVEFTRWKKGEPMRWRLFKKSFIVSKEQWNEMLLKNPQQLHELTGLGIEGHPYQLADGIVNERPNMICMETMQFLKYMVDALNDKARTDDMLREMIMEKLKKSD